MNMNQNSKTQKYEEDQYYFESPMLPSPDTNFSQSNLFAKENSIFIHSEEEETIKTRSGFLLESILGWGEGTDKRAAGGNLLSPLFKENGCGLGKRDEYDCGLATGGVDIFGETRGQMVQVVDQSAMFQKKTRGLSSTEADFAVCDQSSKVKRVKRVEQVERALFREQRPESGESGDLSVIESCQDEGEIQFSNREIDMQAAIRKADQEDAKSRSNIDILVNEGESEFPKHEDFKESFKLNVDKERDQASFSEFSMGEMMFDAEGKFQELGKPQENDTFGWCEKPVFESFISAEESKNDKIRKVELHQDKQNPPKNSLESGKLELKSAKPKKIDLSKLEDFLSKFLKAKPISQELFTSLNQREKKLISQIFTKTHRSNSSVALTHQTVINLQQNGITKRPEENFKCVYKPFIRASMDRFKTKCRAQRNKMMELGEKPELYSDQRRIFYYRKFISLCQSEEDLSMDLVMDICHEKIINAKRSNAAALSQDSNWSSDEKSAAMKKISGSFRYLLSSTPHFRREFTEFVRADAKNGIFSKQEAIIDKKLGSKMKQWRKLYEGLKFEDDEFMGIVGKEIKNPKFKFPWSLVNVRFAVDQSLEDLDSFQIEEEFFAVQRKHYSFQK